MVNIALIISKKYMKNIIGKLKKNIKNIFLREYKKMSVDGI
jgi:hypothetical protein